MTRLAVAQIRGLTPIIDPRRMNEAVITEGRNFYMSADGPLSGFSRQFVLDKAIVKPFGLQSFRISNLDTSFLFTTAAVLEFSDTTRRLFPRVTFPELQFLWPWSAALVGGSWYFTRKGSGLIRFNFTTGVWSILSGGSIPANIVALTAVGGRLIVLAEGIVAWSAIDNGTDFVASTTTGAGAQSLALINATGKDQPLMILPWQHGFLSYTTEGIMRSELVQAINPFRHRGLSRRHIPVNPYSVISLSENEQIMLTRSGFYTTAGEEPEAWEPAMGEFFHRVVLLKLNLDTDAATRLMFDFDRQWLFVSAATGVQSGLYTEAFHFYIPTGQWGKFSRTHTALVDLKLTAGEQVGFTLGYCDTNGSLFKFTDTTHDAVNATGLFIEDFRGAQEWPARREEGINRMPSALYMYGFNTVPFGDGFFIYDREFVLSNPITSLPTAVAAAFVAGVPNRARAGVAMQCGLREIAVRPTQTVLAPLDAQIKIGVFRSGPDKDVDELMAVQNIHIGTLAAASAEITEDYINDFLLDDVNEDWNLDGDTEDWGQETAGAAAFNLRAQGTLDGKEVWENQDKIPELVVEEGGLRLYSTDVTGLFHLVFITTAQANESFHIKTLELNGINVGQVL